jgi:hypothetical protein
MEELQDALQKYCILLQVAIPLVSSTGIAIPRKAI